MDIDDLTQMFCDITKLDNNVVKSALINNSFDWRTTIICLSKDFAEDEEQEHSWILQVCLDYALEIVDVKRIIVKPLFMEKTYEFTKPFNMQIIRSLLYTSAKVEVELEDGIIKEVGLEVGEW